MNLVQEGLMNENNHIQCHYLPLSLSLPGWERLDFIWRSNYAILAISPLSLSFPSHYYYCSLKFLPHTLCHLLSLSLAFFPFLFFFGAWMFRKRVRFLRRSTGVEKGFKILLKKVREKSETSPKDNLSSPIYLDLQMLQ